MYISPKFLFDHLYFKKHDKINIKNSKERRGRGEKKDTGLDLLFSELFLMQKQFQENPDNVLEVEKYSENSENS
jgi:hypothetical protein